MHFYTSIRTNYLPKARVLAKSIRKHCTDVRFSLVLSDKLPDGFDLEKEPFDEVVRIEELNIPVKNLEQWIYTHMDYELCTAVKGQALVKFLEEGSSKVVYLDPDIVVFDDLRELEGLLDSYDVVLTPHQTVPEETREAVIDNEICSLKHGTYNYGFYAARNSPNGLHYAHWWRDRLVDFCYDDKAGGLFTDQRWGDMVPALFDNVCIWKNPACNVAAWNLTHREVTKGGDNTYFVNGKPLKFYHFSGFDSGAHEIMLKKYAKGNPVLFEIFEQYIKWLEEEEQEKYGQYAWCYNYYDNGEPITKEQRVMMRNRMDLIEYFKDVDPRITVQERSYYAWYQNELRLIKEQGGGKKLEQMLAEGKAGELVAQMELSRIYGSRSWKLVTILRRIKQLFTRKKKPMV